MAETPKFQVVLKFGGKDIPISTQMLDEFTVIQDINAFLPSFRIAIQDTDGIFSHVIPFDTRLSDVYVGVNRDGVLTNSFNFKVYRRFIRSSNGVTNIYEIDGLLDVKGLFAPDKSRGFSGSVSSTLNKICGELGITNKEISSSLSLSKKIVQPLWSNAQLLKYLAENLAGNKDEGGYYCFIKTKDSKNTFVFRSVTELNQGPIAQRYLISEVSNVSDVYLPVFDHDITDNYKLFGLFGAKKQAYSYYNFNTSQQVFAAQEITGFKSLTDYFMIDANDSDDSQTIDGNGRSNDFTANFVGKVKSIYHKRMSDLSAFWIFTLGNENLVPGDVVLVEFPKPKIGEQILSRQYSGYWLVKKVVHTFGQEYKNRILLCRNGFDVEEKSSLVAATFNERVKS